MKTSADILPFLPPPAKNPRIYESDSVAKANQAVNLASKRVANFKGEGDTKPFLYGAILMIQCPLASLVAAYDIGLRYPFSDQAIEQLDEE